MIKDAASDIREDCDKDQRFIYPLDKYLVPPCRKQHLNIQESDGKTSNRESLSTLHKIENILKLTENSLKKISTSLLKNTERRTVYLNTPHYLDEDFDELSYIRELVDAKINGFEVVQNPVIPKIFTQNRNNAITTNVSTNQRLNTETNTHRTNAQILDKGNARAMDARNVQYKNTKLFEIKADDLDERPSTISCPRRLSIQVMPSLNIRSELIEQKFPSLNINPADESNVQPESTNIGVVKSKHAEQNEVIGDSTSNIDTVYIPPTVNLAATCNTNMNEDVSYSSGPKSFERSVGNSDYIRKIDRPQRSRGVDFERHPIFDNSYLFLNRSLESYDCNDIPSVSSSKKNISKLKKYAIPEFQKIYNPKSMQFIKRSANIKHFKAGNDVKQTSILSTKNDCNSKYIFMSNSKNDLPVVSNSNIRNPSKITEYIPYSKLTIGGIRADELKYSGALSKQENRVKFKNNDPVVSPGVESHVQCEEESISSTNNASSVTNIDSSSASLVKSERDSDLENSESLKYFKEDKSVIKKHCQMTDRLQTSVQVFDFKHQIETRDNATQSCDSHIPHCKETQTSPLNETTVAEPQNQNASTSKIDINSITIADVLQLEKTLSSINYHAFNDESKSIKSNNDAEKQTCEIDVPNDVISLPKDTQTSPMKSANTMTSPAEMINEKLSPIRVTSNVDVQTSPIENLNETYNIAIDDVKNTDVPSTSKPGPSKDRPNSKKRDNDSFSKNAKIYSSTTDTFTDISQTESSDAYSMGEVNLKILRKKIITILNQSSSLSSTTSFSTSINSDVHLDSTFHSKKSEGEVSSRRHK